MAYVRNPTWKDWPDLSTQITAAKLENIESGIVAAYTQGLGTLVNADIAAGAGIVYSKLALGGNIVNADINAGAAIAKSKLAALAIADADVATGAAIGIAKLADPGSGNVITSTGAGAIAAKPSGYEFGYTEFTTTFTTTVTSEVTAAAVVTAPSITFDGSTKVVVEFFAVGANVNASARSALFVLYDGASSIGIIGEVDSPTAGYGGIAYCRRVFTPAAATKTYSIKAFVSGGAGTCQIAAGTGGVGNNMPGYIRITKA